MADARTFNNTIVGVVIRTTPPYARWLNFDKVIGIVVQALRADVQPDADGYITYRYTAPVRHTSPYREIRFRPHWTPGQYLNIVDKPAGGSSVGYVTVTFENYRLIEGELLHKEPKSGAIYTSEPPTGWKAK